MSKEISAVTKLAERTHRGDLGEDIFLSSDFKDVYEDDTDYLLADVIDGFIDYLTNASFIYMSDEEPENKHIAIWLDTSV